MLVDQSPEGLEVLGGSSTYTYDGNWKVQAENGADGYHVTATHWNYAATTSRRGTNKDVAAEFILSVKTVQYHLTRIYAKLGVSSRTQLAAQWPRRSSNLASEVETQSVATAP